MKTRVEILTTGARTVSFHALGLAAGLVLIACGAKAASQAQIADPDIARAISQKRALAKEMAATATNPVPNEVWRFFDLLQSNYWSGATNMDRRLHALAYANPQPATNFLGVARQLLSGQSAVPTALRGGLWCPVHEALGIADCFQEWDPRLLHRYGCDIIDSIPTNSIYFGGTDPGRFVITALSESHRDGRPFFTLTQNALADSRYLDYLRYIYGAKIYIPTLADSQTAFNNYLADARERKEAGKPMPGEDVTVVGNRVTVSGQVAVMAVNGLLARKIFDQNPGHEFFVEESFPLDWMYPYLSPHDLIFKVNREPLKQLDDELVPKDHEYWRHYTAQLIGDWLRDETPVKDVCAFCGRVYLRHDLAAFTGDKAFVANDAAQKAFSKLRASLGGLYAWRYAHSGSPEEKARMARETDYTFRQALALCPYSPEAVFRYVQFLLGENRKEEATLIAAMWQRLEPTNAQAGGLLKQLRGL